MSAIESLHRIVTQAQARGVSQLPFEDVRAFASLYRRAISDLAEARARGLNPTQLHHAEALLVRAHAILYAPEPLSLGTACTGLFTGLPGAVYEARRYLALATMLMVLGCAWGYLEVARDPSSAATLLPRALIANAEESFQDDATRSRGTPENGAFYFSHNASIALNAYALGATAGVGTSFVDVYNGVILGATFAVVRTMASPKAFFAFILPHSGVELFAILLASAGGLQLGDGLLRPGVRRRRDAMASAARESLPLALGAAFLLAIAGLTEGWISPMPWPFIAKVAIGATLDGMLMAYLLLGARRHVNPGVPGA